MHWAFSLSCCLVSTTIVFAQASSSEAGIPVTDPVVIAKCGTCHTRDQQGNMQRISWERTTPEGWQEALKRMIVLDGVSLTPAEARGIVKYLAASHGLAPEEAEQIRYDAERRSHHETSIPNDHVDHACARCHNFARALSWRRSADDWKQLSEMHTSQLKLPADNEAIAFLVKAAPLHTPEWDAWSSRPRTAKLAGRWLVTASLRGHGNYYGEMTMDATGDDEFTTSVHLTSVNDGSSILRTGRSVVYGSYAWRGRSKGSQAEGSAPDDASADAREALSIAPDQSTADGRWFWGQYQEFGFDVKLRRATSDPTLLLIDRLSMKAGSQTNRIRLVGAGFPARVTPGDLGFGPGVTVRRIVSSAPNEIVAEVDVAADAAVGKRNVEFHHSVLPGAIAIYDRVDYIKVAPDSSMAAFSDQGHGLGYQQFEAIGYQRGPDGKLHTADDVELGPMPMDGVTWSLEVFYTRPDADTDFVGKIGPTGFFTPAAKNPNANFDVWVVATAKNETGRNGKPLVGKSYMVVTVPMYTFNGRRFVRDIDRWVDDGPTQ